MGRTQRPSTTGRHYHRLLFVGNAVILGCCDVIIATHDSNIGLGGPAMIEGGGLGVFHPKDVGPLRDSVPSGVVDIVVPDEAAAVIAAKRYISYFQGRTEVGAVQTNVNFAMSSPRTGCARTRCVP